MRISSGSEAVDKPLGRLSYQKTADSSELTRCLGRYVCLGFQRFSLL